MRFRHLLFAIAVGLVLWQLMLPPVKGVANNGDWGKVLGQYGIGCDVAYQSICARLVYAPEYVFGSGFRSTEHLFVAPALAIASWTRADGSLDLRIMGSVHAAFYLLALFLALRCVRSALAAVVAVALFTDFLYLGYLNSFFMDAAALIFTGGAVACYIWRIQSRRPAATIALFACMLGAIFSKPQYALMAICFAALFWAARRVLVPDARAAIAAVLALLAAGAISLIKFAPPTYANKGVFTVFFSHVMTHTSDPDRTLAEFGLDHSYRRYIGDNAYTVGPITDQPDWYQPFLAKVSYFTIGRYYLRHPAVGWSHLTQSLGDSGAFHAPGGNFDVRDRPRLTQYEGLQWASKVKHKLFYKHGARFFGAFVGLCALFVSLALRLRRKLPEGSVEGAIALVALAWIVLAVSAFADVLEPLRHSLVFLAIFDMLVVGSVALLATSFAGGIRRPR